MRVPIAHRGSGRTTAMFEAGFKSRSDGVVFMFPNQRTAEDACKIFHEYLIEIVKATTVIQPEAFSSLKWGNTKTSIKIGNKEFIFEPMTNLERVIRAGWPEVFFDHTITEKGWNARELTMR